MAPKTYSPEEFNGEMDAFDKLADKCSKNKKSAVKLRAAERDLLKGAESLRNMYLEIVKGDKNYLQELFGPTGTSAALFAHVKDLVLTFELSDVNSNDTRWRGLKEAIEIIEEILDKYGIGWKRWGPPKAPESLVYETFDAMTLPEADLPEGTCTRTTAGNAKVKRLTPGASYTFEPTVTGCDIVGLSFEVHVDLPEGLSLDPTTGVISGAPTAGVELDTHYYMITATNNAGTAQAKLEFNVRDGPPWNLTYTPSKEVFTGDSVKWFPSNDGGAPRKYSIEPELPIGLRLDESTGVISGIPLKPCKDAEYTVSAKNSAGACKGKLIFSVMCSPPVNVEYPDASGALPFGGVVYLTPNVELKRIAAQMQKVAKWGRIFSTSGAFIGTKWGKARQVLLGTVVNVNELPELEFSITPELPPGLSLATKTGVISGKPTSEFPQQVFRLTCKNDGGTCTSNVTLGVKMVAPSQLKYPEASKALTIGSPVTMEPEVQGSVTEWSVEPKLPAGLHIDPAMGTICGVPSELSPETTYIVSASNSVGKTSGKVIFSVQQPEPSNLVYKDLQVEYPIGRELELRPTIEGEVQSFEIDQPLPKGLSFDTTTGILSGTPEEVCDDKVYTITAENIGGNCHATVAFSVKVLGPTELTYPSVDEEYGVGEPVNLVPQVVGGATKFWISPDLPNGLTLDEKTGAIIGSPTATCPEVDYTVVAENEAGGTGATITFKVVNHAPADLTYPEAASSDAAHTNILQIGQSVNWEPAISQSLGAKYSIDKPLPAGMTFDENTGVICGTPTEPSDMSEYTITAKNSAGETSTKLKLQVAKPPEPEPAAPTPTPAAPVEAVAAEAPREAATLTSAGAAVEMDAEDIKLAEKVAGEGTAVEAQQAQIDKYASFVKILENCTRIEDLPPNPSIEGEKSMNWMYWMVHRMHLNDPTLDTLDFSNATMPLPHIEPRIAPKLMKAIHTNTHCKRLKLSNSNLQKPQGQQLADALKDNKTIELLDIQSNCLDADKIKLIAEALTINLDSAIYDIKLENQHQLPTFGRATEEAIAKMVVENKKIVKLSCTIKDPHWQGVANKAVMANNDAARRARKAAAGIEDKPVVLEVKAVKRNLTKIIFSHVPPKAPYEYFDDDNPRHFLVRKFIAEKKTFPTKDQLQKWAKQHDKPLPFKDVAVVMKDCYKVMFESVLHNKITLMENMAPFVGDLNAWSEKNDRFVLDLWPKKDQRFDFQNSSTAPIAVEDAVAEWIVPQEKKMDGGTLLTMDEFKAKYGDEADAKWEAAGAWK
mmetsp:Transcript_92263/g.192959  ORF Transcript_92263/g.192959 Transcript_92263/m.192959 type:complete len:1279 (+) Transcript_92263:137-3973(+)